MTVPSQFTSLRGFIVYSHMYSHSGYTQMFLCVSVFDVAHMQPVSSLSLWILVPSTCFSCFTLKMSNISSMLSSYTEMRILLNGHHYDLIWCLTRPKWYTVSYKFTAGDVDFPTRRPV